MAASVSQHTFTAKQVLEHEGLVASSLSIALYDLMESAGLAVFQEIEAMALPNKSLLVLAGKGNNAGDGFVIARLAAAAGFQVTLVLLTSEDALTGDALQAYQQLADTQVNILPLVSDQQLTSFLAQTPPHIIVDALFGIGFRGQLPALYAEVLERVNSFKKTAQSVSLAVDLPSGVNASTGDVNSIAFEADITVSFIVHKRGLFTAQACNYVGKLVLKPLMMTSDFCQQVPTNCFLQTPENLPAFPSRKPSAHKGSIGLLLSIGGNQNMPGAIKLASYAALRSGASLVSVVSHPNSQLLVHSQIPELMLAGTSRDDLIENKLIQQAKALLIGPGLGQNQWAQQLCEYVIEQTVSLNLPMVVDADGLNWLAQHPRYYAHWVLTPHPGEAARLLACSIADIEENRFAAAANIAQKFGGICVLKGAGSLITDGEQCWINTSGNPAMASGGMGDVLSGIIAALLMQFDDKLNAVRFAVFLHGYIADQIVAKQGNTGLLASDIAEHIPAAIHSIT